MSSTLPLLFSLYVDIVLEKLGKSNIGCYINGLCFNSFMYADDLILLNITVSDMQSLLNICVQSLSDLDLPINIDKSICMRVGPMFKAVCANLCIKEQLLQWANNMSYLGIDLCRACEFKCNWKMAKNNFFFSSNTILGNLGSA